MNLPDDLYRLPPQVLDVIRHLGTQEDSGAWLDDMMVAMGMSERGLRKWLRRLVTRFYAEMPIDGYYVLTAAGQKAAQTLREYDAANPGVANPASRPAGLAVDEEDSDEFPVTVLPPMTPAQAPVVQAPAAPVAQAPVAQAPANLHQRRLLVVAPKELVARQPVTVKIGFDGPERDQPPLNRSARAVLRLSAPGCDVKPTERPLDIAPDAFAGPLLFEVTPRLPGQVRIKVEVFQLVTLRELVPAGGLYFDLAISAVATPASRSVQARGARVGLRHPPA